MKLELILLEDKDWGNKEGVIGLCVKNTNNRSKGDLMCSDRTLVNTEFYKPQFIVLIDTEAEIEAGDLYYDLYPEGAFGTKGDPVNKCYNPEALDEGSYKILSSTDKSHNLPLLSEASIKTIIEYYNKNDKMPDSVSIETLSGHINVYNESVTSNMVITYFNELGQYSGIKLNEDKTIDVNIIEDRKYLLTSYDGVKMYEGDVFWYTMNGCTVHGCKKPSVGSKYYSSKEIAKATVAP